MLHMKQKSSKPCLTAKRSVTCSCCRRLSDPYRISFPKRLRLRSSVQHSRMTLVEANGLDRRQSGWHDRCTQHKFGLELGRFGLPKGLPAPKPCKHSIREVTRRFAHFCPPMFVTTTIGNLSRVNARLNTSTVDKKVH